MSFTTPIPFSKPRILISNDDGVAAPGLVALCNALNAAAFCAFSVCGPAGERSAQSHCITLGKHLHAFEIPIEGAEEAFAIDGTPADSVMIALHGPLLKNPNFDLVVSGINRGDNCGLHVIYSGTVGAAREASCKSLASIAFSLDSYKARTVEQYEAAAECAVAIIKATLGLSQDGTIGNTIHPIRPVLALRGYVLNVNFPRAESLEGYTGLYLSSQGEHCSFPDFQEVDSDPHFENNHDGRVHHSFKIGKVTLRAFRNAAGYLRTDERPGTDSWAVREGWVSVTAIGLRSDVPMNVQEAVERVDERLKNAVEGVVRAAGKQLGLEIGGVSAKGKPADVQVSI